MRIWVSRTGDGGIGAIRVTGHSPTRTGKLVVDRLAQFLASDAGVDGFSSYGLHEFQPAAITSSYAAEAEHLVSALREIAEDHSDFVELRQVDRPEPDPAAVADSPSDAGGVAWRFRLPAAGPAFVPIRRWDGSDVWKVFNGACREKGASHVVSGREDSPSWDKLLALFQADSRNDLSAGRNLFFRVRKAGTRCEVSATFVVVGPYVAFWDPTSRIVTVTIPAGAVLEPPDQGKQPRRAPIEPRFGP